MPTTSEQIVAEARKLLGTPHAHQGRLVGVGLDCVGVLVVVATALGLDHEDRRRYGRNAVPDELESELAANLEIVPVNEARCGDVGAFWLLRANQIPQHVGILTPGPRLIHSHEGTGRVVENRVSVAWQARMLSAWRFAGVGEQGAPWRT